MLHPEVLAAPVLMLLDYYLTLYGATLSEKAYGQHFKGGPYEMNPLWQQAVANHRWINPRLLALVGCLTAILVLLSEVPVLDDGSLNALLGFILMPSGLMLGRHVANILTFSHLVRHPGDVSGEVKLSHGFLLSFSIYQLTIVGFPLALVAVFSPSPFVLGAVAAIPYLACQYWRWLVRARRRSTAPV